MAARIDFIFFDAGGGHRAAATALRSVVERRNRPWEARLVNLQEILDEADPFRKITGVRLQDCYNLLLENGWTLGSSQLLKALQNGIRLFHATHVRLLKEFWNRDAPDMVVSLVPNFNRALFRAYEEVRPGAPYVTVLTDMADYPPHFWIERQDQWYICGTEKAARQATDMGVPAERIARSSGMILRPGFYSRSDVDRASERRRLGLREDLPTGLVMFGGHGSSLMLDIAGHLQRSHTGLQMIYMCGRNDKLARRLRNSESRFPVHVEGFTSEIPHFMRLADFFIGKPGPGSISEAIAMDLPVIVQRNVRTLPQERYNADWVLENDLGLVVGSFKEIAAAVAELLEPGALERRRKAAASIENRAVFEIPEILEWILRAAGNS